LMLSLKNHKVMIDCFSSVNEGHAGSKRMLMDMIRDAESHSINDEMEIVSRTDMNFRATDRSWVNPFILSVAPHMDAMCQQMMMGTWNISSAWFFEYHKGEYAQWHVHPNCMWTNVYYLDMPEGSPRTTVLSMPSGEEMEICNIEEGMILSFPSTMIHCSRPNKSDKPKTVIAFNSDFDSPTIHTKFPVQDDQQGRY
jgi:hypothetical protein